MATLLLSPPTTTALFSPKTLTLATRTAPAPPSRSVRVNAAASSAEPEKAAAASPAQGGGDGDAAAAEAPPPSSGSAVLRPKKPAYSRLDYIYEDRGEVLDIRIFETGEYALIAWVGIPTPPAWLPTDMLIKSEKLDYERI
ncbi:NAD(P)H-quinone oxidoreductase subunit O, chloroplastic [Ananas comosus]|uniref:NAD(P)H-quinone oxidoreductase subunit O, chloroplastic n=1 Tax=Ananas comosus TaxID=4615 RepID=A0A199UM18_ANACO|nr:NAD(P)H-quinone oxidoreductase subunit O, chloroplastic [Ananas comosus]